MTDQSRVEKMTREEYIADAIYDAVFDGNSAPVIARIAIRASDAWLKERVDIAASRIKDRWMHVQPRETLSWHQVAETTVEALLWEPDK